MRIQWFKNLFCGFIFALLFSSCSNGACGNNQTNQNIVLNVTSPSVYPVGTEFTAYAVITNSTNSDATNLLYTIESNTIGQTPVVQPINNDSNCTNIISSTSCIVAIHVPAGTTPGSFMLVVHTAESNSLTQTTYSETVNTPNTIFSTIISLVDIPNTNYPFFILPDDQTVISPTNESTIVYVSILNTTNAAPFNDLQLVDESGNLLNYQLLNNQLNTESNGINSYQITIPASQSLQIIRAISYLNNTPVCTSSCSNQSVVNISHDSIGILSIEPSYFRMSESYTQQQLLIRNQGSNTISNIELPLIDPALSISNNTCSSTLSPGASCQLVVNYHPEVADGHTSYAIQYYNGLYQTHTLITISYTGLSMGILTITPDSLTLTPENPEQTVILQNTGNAALTLTTLPLITSPLQLVSTTCTSSQVLAIHDTCSYTINYLATESAGSSLLTFEYNNGVLNQNSNLVVNWQAYLQKIMFLTANKWLGNLVGYATQAGWDENSLSPEQLTIAGVYAANYLCQKSAQSFGYDVDGKTFVAVINGGTKLNNFSGYYVNIAESRIFSGDDAEQINPVIYSMPGLMNAVLIQGQNAESDITLNQDHWYWTAASPDGSFITESGYTGRMADPLNFNGIANANCSGFTNYSDWGIVGRQSSLIGLNWWNYNTNTIGQYNTDPIGTAITFSAVAYAKTIGTENALWCAEQ